MARSHDPEWGVPVLNDRRLFEFLILEGAQAGLSWETVLKKSLAYRKAFDHFDARKIARYGPGKARQLLGNPGIIRNRFKIKAATQNARAFSPFNRSSAASTGTSGNSSAANPSKTPGGH